MNKIVNHIKQYRIQILIVIVFIYLQVITDLTLPDYMSRIVNEGIVEGNNDLIVNTGMQMLLITLAGACASIVASYLSAKIATGLAHDLRLAIFSKVENYSLTEFDKFSTSSLITRSTNDIQQIQKVSFMFLRIVVSAPIMGIGAIIKANNTAPSMSWIIALSVVLLLGTVSLLLVISFPKFKSLQKLIDRLNLVTRENLTGLRVIRAFTNEKYEEAKFEKANRKLTTVNLFLNRLMVIINPALMLILNLATLGIFWIGAHLIDNGGLKIGDMLAFMQYTMQVIISFLMLSIMFILIPRAIVSFTRINEVLASKPKIRDPNTPKKYSGNVVGKVEFDNVTFFYPNSDIPVLKNISFVVHPGQTVAIIGSTGSGKSTLVNLILRFYDVTTGKVLVNNLDVRDVTQEELHKRIGFVPQKEMLFSGTIKSNIKYGAQDMDNNEVIEVAKTAQADEFIMKLEGTYSANVAQCGANLSGGQKQRLAIARAVAKKPEIYLFDDSFSALDFRTDTALRKALRKATSGSTIFIITQRISTILHADKIIVMDQGIIVGRGTHKQLIKTCPIYKEIAKSQFSEKEMTSTISNVDKDRKKEKS